MISIRSSYHPIDAAILWCGLADYQDEILRVDVSQPGCLRKHFPQWPALQKHLECICDAIICGELPATFLGHPITSDHQVRHEYCSVRRADLVVWFVRTAVSMCKPNALPLQHWQFKQWQAYSGGNCCATISRVTCPHRH